MEQSLKKDGIKRSDEGFSLGREVELVFLEQNVNKRNDNHPKNPRNDPSNLPAGLEAN